MRTGEQNKQGFTIVELLIVIVVIGILAAISLVAFNGVTERAESTKVISQAKAYIKGLNAWSVETGVRPPGISSCIAPASSISGGVCPLAPRWSINAPYDTGFNQSLLTYAGVGAASPFLGRYGEANPRGSMWYHTNFWSDNRAVFFYEVGPSTDCGLPGVLSQNPGWDNATLLGESHSGRYAGYTQCLIEVFKY